MVKWSIPFWELTGGTATGGRILRIGGVLAVP